MVEFRVNIMRKTIFILILILFISYTPITVYAGVSIFDRGPSERKPARTSKSSALEKAEKAFIKGEYEEVLRIGSSYLTYCAKPDEKMQYLMGKTLLKLKRFDEARNRFSRILNDSDDYRFLDKACIGLADSYYIEGDYKKA
ncbi:MAG: tetratricopeptide repeat protein, partial [Candidatus Omnitrophota bacterium]|nr:tetratricopeptide repeat protein [Candidatus Omnitrophota bacterium]